MKSIIFIAPPAAGKGTQAKLLSDNYNIPHISTGDLLRDESSKDTELGREIKYKIDNGIFVSDELILELVKNRISEIDCANGYILDGYPRNVSQALDYDGLLDKLNKDLGIVIFMDIDKNLALDRVLSRVVCSNCGSSYNLFAVKPKCDGICDRCGHELKVRGDDNKDTFLNRFDTYMNETASLIDYYRNRNVLVDIKIESNKTPEDIFNEIKEILDK